MCLFFLLLILSPRAAIIFWWIFEPGRWDAAFGSVVWPILGFVFLPWTTLMWVAVAPFGNVAGWDWLWLALGFLADISSLSSSGYANRGRIPRYA
jgi:hypothetical protein